MSKTLYVLVSNGGDGSYYPRYTLDADLIQKFDEAYSAGRMDGEDIGCDGDGFHYDTIQVPDDATPESLGISVIDPERYAHFFQEE